MLYACVQRFDVTENLKKFGILGATEQAPSQVISRPTQRTSHTTI
jgi:hypothetical protein